MEARAVGRQLASDWRALRSAIAGDVVLASASEYATLRRLPVARFDDRFLTVAETAGPEAIVLCREPADAAATIAFARRFGLETAVRSGGHCFARRSFTSGVVIDVSSLRSVSVAGGVATVGAGPRLGDWYESLAAEQLTIAGGCGPSVGIAGLTLGGGGIRSRPPKVLAASVLITLFGDLDRPPLVNVFGRWPARKPRRSPCSASWSFGSGPTPRRRPPSTARTSRRSVTWPG